MSALVDRIAEVLRAHKWENLRCCRDATDAGDHAAHVAERVAAELQSEQDRQLTEAWQVGFNEGMKHR